MILVANMSCVSKTVECVLETGREMNSPLVRTCGMPRTIKEWKEFWKEDIELAEMGMEEYNKELQRIDKEDD